MMISFLQCLISYGFLLQESLLQAPRLMKSHQNREKREGFCRAKMCVVVGVPLERKNGSSKSSLPPPNDNQSPCFINEEGPPRFPHHNILSLRKGRGQRQDLWLAEIWGPKDQKMATEVDSIGLILRPVLRPYLRPRAQKYKKVKFCQENCALICAMFCSHFDDTSLRCRSKDEHLSSTSLAREL